MIWLVVITVGSTRNVYIQEHTHLLICKIWRGGWREGGREGGREGKSESYNAINGN